jgi:protein-tyrosine phosphatase
MVDIHSHILHGVDDGARTIEDSLAMLRAAAQHGTTDIVATPHANSNYQFDRQILDSRYEEIARLHRGLPRVHRGCDFHLSAANVQQALVDASPYTVNGGPFLMVELPDMFHATAMDEVLRQLTQKGLICVVTHPERNPVLQRSPDILARWVRGGCRAQLTAMSLTGGFGPGSRAAAWQFLRAGNVHFVASDAHDIQYRPPHLDMARDLLDQEIGTEIATLLVEDHPRCVIECRDIPMDVIPPVPERKWFEFWKS